jgi:mannose-6-phosphate isomerase-like protein (cupin superfamily)
MRHPTAVLLTIVAAGIVASAAGTFAPARGQPAQSARADTVVALIPAQAIVAAERSLAAATSPEDVARELPSGDPSRYQFVVLSRRAAAAAELHDRWADVVFVRSGRAVLRTGHSLAQRRPRGGGGEWLGAIENGQDRPVGPGDVVVIPAGIAHQWHPSGSEPLVYRIMKVNTHAGP